MKDKDEMHDINSSNLTGGKYGQHTVSRRLHTLAKIYSEGGGVA